MSSTIKKFWAESLNKWVVGIASAFLITFSTMAKDYFQRFWSLPEKVEHMRIQRMQDSVQATVYMREVGRLARRAYVDSIYLMNDFENIRKCKEKLKIKD